MFELSLQIFSKKRALSSLYTETNIEGKKCRAILNRFNEQRNTYSPAVVPRNLKVDHTDKTKVVQTETKISGKIVGYLVRLYAKTLLELKKTRP
jgi:hypothetical protein